VVGALARSTHPGAPRSHSPVLPQRLAVQVHLPHGGEPCQARHRQLQTLLPPLLGVLLHCLLQQLPVLLGLLPALLAALCQVAAAAGQRCTDGWPPPWLGGPGGRRPGTSLRRGELRLEHLPPGLLEPPGLPGLLLQLQALLLLMLLLLTLLVGQPAQLPSVTGVGARAAAVYETLHSPQAVPRQQGELLFGVLGRRQRLWVWIQSLAAQ